MHVSKCRATRGTTAIFQRLDRLVKPKVHPAPSPIIHDRYRPSEFFTLPIIEPSLPPLFLCLCQCTDPTAFPRQLPTRTTFTHTTHSCILFSWARAGTLVHNTGAVSHVPISQGACHQIGVVFSFLLLLVQACVQSFWGGRGESPHVHFRTMANKVQYSVLPGADVGAGLRASIMPIAGGCCGV